MHLPHFLSQIPQLTANFDPRTAAFLYVLCAIGELGASVPYILESVWLLAGYQLGAGVLSPLHLGGFWLAAQAGRQTGTMALYFITRLSSSPLARLYQKITSSRFWPKTPSNNNVLKRINLTSSFSLAYGRLVGLRFPLTIMLALKKKPVPALTGVLLSSLVWDGIYITLGATVGRTMALKPAEMLLASLAALTLVYLVVFLVRRLFKRVQPASH
jgi:membrane-associated protein